MKAKPSKKKSAKSPSRKTSKKPVSNSKAVTKVPTKLPISTFDLWVAKQVRLGNVKPAEGPSKTEETVLPKDTFEIWIEKQKPRESVQQKEVSPTPDTFDLWVSKQVAQRDSDHENKEMPTAETAAVAGTP